MSGYADLKLKWLDGPGLVEWLRENVPMTVEQGSLLEARLQDWERGGAASLYTVDELLIRHDRHPIELPLELWRDRSKRTGKRAAPELRREAVAAVLRGEGVRETARRLGINPRSIYNWRKAEAAVA